MKFGPQAGAAVLGAALLVAIAGRLFLGSTGFGWPDADIVRYRVAATAAACAVGAALAISGLFLQVLLRNPLASPFVLGLSSGAGFGYMLAMYLAWRFGLGLDGFFGVAAPVVAATLGSLVTLGVVWRIGSRPAGDSAVADPVTLVLAGVVVSAIAGAGSTALQSLVPAGLRGDFVAWMMGRIPDAPPVSLLVTVAVLALAGTALGALLGPALDAASLSDDEAISVGVALRPLRTGLFVFAGTLAAATVALAGPIAFVGLVAPHAARMLLGARHRPLAVGSALAGATLLVAADAARQAVDLGGGRLPVGVLTAIAGGPIFLWLLRSTAGRRGAA
ncbi:MAG: iron ABC transporter permease [Phycisphaerae bacterium]|nr:iron ABC transporter permease [Phycisphaerae bacterium]MDZ4831971.1 iron ABC transporter permease [Phycisphaerae bacterium]